MSDTMRSLNAGGAATVTPWGRMWRGTRQLARVMTDGRLTRVGIGACVVFVVFAVVAPWFSPDPLAQTTDVLRSPTIEHPFGTDQLGRDILARVASGARISLAVAALAVVLGMVIAVPAGMIAGYRGGTLVDEAIMRVVDVVLSLPLIVMAMFVLGVFGTGSTTIGPFTFSAAWKIILLIGLGAMPFFARVARSATLVEMHEDYVTSLRTLGVSEKRILFREVLVNILPPILVQAFLWMAIAIFSEAALSFLGLGIQPPEPTLGTILFDASTYMFGGVWWYSLFPGLVLLFATVGFNLVGDGLNDYLDPQLRQ